MLLLLISFVINTFSVISNDCNHGGCAKQL